MTVFQRLLAAQADGRCKEQPNWEAYLVTAVTNACRDIIKAARNDEEIDDTDPRIHRDAPLDPTPDTAIDHLEHATQVATLTAALDTLDERSRTIIISRYVHGLTNRAIGVNLGLTGQRVGKLHDKVGDRFEDAWGAMHRRYLAHHGDRPGRLDSSWSAWW